MILKNKPLLFEFHISKKSRKKYKVNESLFSIRGNIIIADFKAARFLAQQINEIRKTEGKQENQVTAGQINGLGLMHEILHFLLRYYEEKENPGVFSRALNHLETRISPEELNSVLLDFVEKFPPMAVYKNEVSPVDYIHGVTGNKMNREIILEEIYLLNIENINPATRSLEELYSYKELSNPGIYQRLIDESEVYFKNEKPIGSDNLPLFDFLKKPIISNPYSLEGQLDFIRENWSFYIFEIFNTRLLG